MPRHRVTPLPDDHPSRAASRRERGTSPRRSDLAARVCRALAVGVILLSPTGEVHAQTPSTTSTTRNIVSVVEDMRVYTQALGVDCSFCHVGGQNGRLNYRSEDNPRKQVARTMIAMTADINKMVGLGRSEDPATAVTCRTCHRGVPNPRPMHDIIRRAVEHAGGGSAAAEYRQLREKYYGAEAYDFREETLLGAVQTFIDGRPDDAIALLEMNLEFNPRSSRGYSLLAHAYTRRRDDAAAIAALEKALELDANNSIARGQLEQLRRYQRRR